jgi:predicted ATPase
MTRLKIKNIGPVKEGFNTEDGFLDFKGITVFIGNQGSGKSTVAKVFSTLSWIEKALVRGDFKASHLTSYNRFKKFFDYQGISNYFNENTYIEYLGQAYKIVYQNNQLAVYELLSAWIERDTWNERKVEYNFPKIMYVPAERNFVSSVDRPDLIKRLPLPLYTFLEEYEAAKQSIGKDIQLPIGKVKFQYRKQNKKSLLVGTDYEINLLEASSGFQSLVPLFLVSRYLIEIIKENGNSSHKEISVDQEKKIRKEMDKILNNDKISDEVKSLYLERLSQQFKYACFLNIVEEPEQNLYPYSQKEILFELLRNKNEIQGNNLVITTHSPYIINYLTLAIKAHSVKQKAEEQDNLALIEKLNLIVPLKSTVDSVEVNIFQILDNGSIEKLPDYQGLPSDENFLNEFLAESNDSFVKLLEIEDQCQ